MRVSFDLDDTILFKEGAPQCDTTLLPRQRRIGREYLRTGCAELFPRLSELGCELWIYTNSYRSIPGLKDWLASCGFTIAEIVNQIRHDEMQEQHGILGLRPMKCPSWFGIDLHIDDSEIVENDGRDYGFAMLRVSPDDQDWVNTVLAEVQRHLGQ